MKIEKQQDKADTPYPQIGAMKKNEYYAYEMLSNVGGCTSEMSAISLYVYNHLYEEPDLKDISTIFIKIAMVEMHHLNIFGSLAVNLGADPRLWDCINNKMVYWTPSYNNYPTDYCSLIQNSLASELATIEKYKYQAMIIKEPLIVDCLNRVIVDEEIHVAIFKELLNEYHTC